MAIGRIPEKSLKEKNIETLIVYSPVILLATAELSLLDRTLIRNVPLGVLLYSIILVGLIAGIGLLHRAGEKEGSGRYKNAGYLFEALTILPLTRLLGFALPLKSFSQIYWPLIIGVPLLIALWILSKNLHLKAGDVGLIKGNPGMQIIIASSGVLFGFIEYLIIRPRPLIASSDTLSILIAGSILMIFTGFIEELVFRGLLQTASSRYLGAFQGIVYVSILFTIMHTEYGSVPEMLYVFCVSLFYGVMFYRTKTLWGVMVSHGTANVVLLLVAPFVL